MSLLQSILMGLIQGLTEFLPVSSSGHLAIFQIIFGMNTDSGLLFETLLHLGTLVAVCVVFKSDILKLLDAVVHMIGDAIGNLRIFISNRTKHTDTPYRKLINTAYKKFVALIVVTSIPTAVIGLILSSWAERASASLLVPGICLVITAILLLIADTRPSGKKKVKKTGYSDAAIVGVAQGISTLPGLSRSGATITTCMMLGFDRAFAVKYSFIAAIPAVVGANLLELRHLGEAAASGTSPICYIAGMVVAGVVGYFAIKLMMKLVKSNRFQYFAYYCAVVGIISIVFYFFRG